MLASAGANVAMHGMGDPAKLTGIRDSIAAEHDIKTFYSDADLRKPKAIREMMQKIHGEFGVVDILVSGFCRSRAQPSNPCLRNGGTYCAFLRAGLFWFRGACPGYKLHASRALFFMM